MCIAFGVIIGCGDSGGRGDSASQTSTLPATDPTLTGTVPTTSVTDGVSMTDSEVGSMSQSESQTTPSSPTDMTVTPTDPTVTTGPITVTDPTPGTTLTTMDTTETATATLTDTDVSTGDPCEGGMGFDFSYLWVANTDQGSLSKINTMTLTEEARYFADPTQSGAASTSRTSVNITGTSWSVSNRGTGWVTKVAASLPTASTRTATGRSRRRRTRTRCCRGAGRVRALEHAGDRQRVQRRRRTAGDDLDARHLQPADLQVRRTRRCGSAG
jgi:hypothetical protein